MPIIHPTAIIDPDSHLADDVTVGPYCVIGPNVRIGSGTRLLNNVTILRDARIGSDNAFYPYCIIAGDPQDRKYRGESTMLRIGDRNQIRELVTIHRGTGKGGGLTQIGNDCMIMASAHVAHDCIIGDNVTIANAVMLAGHVLVERGASIGGGAGLHHFTTVGAYSFVGGMARVPMDVPPYMLVEGSPAAPRKVNDVALKRSGRSPEIIAALKDAFRRLYLSNGAPISHKVELLRKDYADIDEIQRLCNALEASAKGVHGRALETLRSAAPNGDHAVSHDEPIVSVVKPRLRAHASSE